MKMWKQLLAALAVGTICMGGIAQTAAAEERTEIYGDLTYTMLLNGTIEITDCDETAIKVTIPAEINGVAVTSVGENSFSDCSKLSSVTIPEGVTSIGMFAFSNCGSLTDITLPDSVTSIDAGAFYSCTALTEITIPDSVIMIGYSAFQYCYALSDVTLPKGITSIEDDTFSRCKSLRNITIPAGVQSIGEMAFAYCDALTGITLPDGVTSIGTSAFCKCFSMTGVTLPNSLTSIGMSAFSYCDALTSVTIPDNVTSIGGRAFYQCEGLTEIVVSENNLNYASENGVLLDKNKTQLICYPTGKQEEKYTVPDSVASIGTTAFSGCDSLTGIVIPHGVTSVAEKAFSDCTGLTDVYYGGTKAEWNAVTIAEGNEPFTSASVHYTIAIQTDTGTVMLSYHYLEDNTIEITGCDRLVESLVIPAEINGTAVTGIGYEAFSGCNGLTSVTIPAGVTNIAMYAFSECTGLTDVYYNGTTEAWNRITIEKYNDGLLNAVIHCSDGDVQYENRGDVDGDGKVTMSDAYTALLASSMFALGADSGLTDAQLTAADVDSDGKLTMTDAYWILLYSSYVYVGEEITWEELITPMPQPPVQTKGNLDGDDKVTMSDAYTALLASSMFALGADSGLTDAQITAADVDGDGKVTMTDAYWILLYSSYVYVGEEITWEELIK